MLSLLPITAAHKSCSDKLRHHMTLMIMCLWQGIGALESSAKSGSLVDAKKSFVTAVSALQTWADDAGIAASLKGL